MTSRIVVFIFLLFSEGTILSQQFILSGRITSGREALPFATVMVKGTSLGTNSNAEGYYSLRLPAGEYEIIFYNIGFNPQSKKITLHSDQKLDAELRTDGIALAEVKVTAGENPANKIIRNAIKQKDIYLTQVNTYSCEAYIKALQKIESMPKNIKGLLKLFGGEASDTNDLKGVLYLSESQNKYYYQYPDKEKEIMFSSKVSGNNQSFSFNKLSDIKLNFYRNIIEMGNLSNRPFISPLHDNAFLFYRYYLQATIAQDGHTIHKIKVVPRKNTDPCFYGTIYIQDSLWRLTGADVFITKETKINFVDTLNIKQLFAPVSGDSVWMPVTLNFAFSFKVFGFIGQGYFNAHLHQYKIEPELGKDFFSRETLIVQAGSNNKDSAYWNANRAVPLTEEERQDYRAKDSITRIRGRDEYKDSSDRVANRLKLRDVLMGYEYRRTRKNLTISMPGIATAGIQFNTVEGPNISYNFNLQKEFEDLRQKNLNGRVRYGISNELWGGELSYRNFFDPMKRSSFTITARSIVEQFNKEQPILPLINSIYSLYLNDNYLKLYKETGIEANYSTEMVNGVYLYSGVQFATRSPLKNTSDLIILNDINKRYTSNDPLHSFSEDSLFDRHNALIAEITLMLRPGQRYYTLPHQKVTASSKYPRINITYKKGIQASWSAVNFDLAALQVSDAIRLGLFGRLSYRIRGGYFLNSRKLYLMDYKHFAGNQTIIQTGDPLGSFRLLPYYRYSADKWYAECHAEHHFQGIIFGQLPLVKKTSWQEVVGFHYLSNNRLDQYYEVNFGIERIFRIIRVDYVAAYSTVRSFTQGFTLGLVTRF